MYNFVKNSGHMVNNRKGGTVLKCAYFQNNVYPLLNPPGGKFILNTFVGEGFMEVGAY